MKISAIRITNYKGFLDSGFIELSDSWNVIIGQNNAGKTAFIESFRLSKNEPRPHKNIFFPRDHPYPPISSFVGKLCFSRKWLKNCWLSSKQDFDLPVRKDNSNPSSFEPEPTTFWEGVDLQVTLEFGHNSAKSEWPSHRLLVSQDDTRTFVRLTSTADRQAAAFFRSFDSPNDSLPLLVNQNYAARIYVFDAKRFSLGECGHQDTAILAPDASNLPAVLAKMAANPSLFQEFNQNMNVIFPSIRWIAPNPKGNAVEIRIWTIDPSTRRDDLAIPLNESGTGVGQVLAILYVAMTIEPGVIAIDEPNSFLHPGAAKKLIQILKRYPQHQYVISTHSPELIDVAQPAALHLVRFESERGTSIVQTFGETEIETKRMMLEEVGASLADVFSADRVIWVEGPTERECFELIVAFALNGPIFGLAFVALRNTGDLDGKQAGVALDIYDALTQGSFILPISIWFSFDREGKSEKEIADLNRRCSGRAKFLPRRMIENYFLNPIAICIVLKALGEKDVTPEGINQLLKKHATHRISNGVITGFMSEEFLLHVDGAKLLADVFSEASDARHNYRKVRDGLELLKVILKESPESISGLIQFVEGLVTLQHTRENPAL